MAYLTFVKSEFRMSYKKFILITSGLILFAIIDEYHQKFIPGRAFNLKDIYSNIGGILGALVFCMIVFRVIVNQKSGQD
jgi:VanZ family protein